MHVSIVPIKVAKGWIRVSYMLVGTCTMAYRLVLLCKACITVFWNGTSHGRVPETRIRDRLQCKRHVYTLVPSPFWDEHYNQSNVYWTVRHCIS